MNGKRSDLIKDQEICGIFLDPCCLRCCSLVLKHTGWIYTDSQVSNFLFINFFSATWGFFVGEKKKAYNNMNRWVQLKVLIQSLPRDLSVFLESVSTHIDGLLWADFLCYPKSVRNHVASRTGSVNRWVGIIAKGSLSPGVQLRDAKRGHSCLSNFETMDWGSFCSSNADWVFATNEWSLICLSKIAAFT